MDCVCISRVGGLIITGVSRSVSQCATHSVLSKSCTTCMSHLRHLSGQSMDLCILHSKWQIYTVPGFSSSLKVKVNVVQCI